MPENGKVWGYPPPLWHFFEPFPKVEEISTTAGNAFQELSNINDSNTFKTKALEHIQSLKNMIQDLDSTTYVSIEPTKSKKKIVKPWTFLSKYTNIHTSLWVLSCQVAALDLLYNVSVSNLFFSSTGNPEMLTSVHLFVHTVLVLVCQELSIFIFLAQIHFKSNQRAIR